MHVVPFRNAAFALSLLGSVAAFGACTARAQQPATPGKPVSGPNASQQQAADRSAPSGDVQPVPGAMPGSDTVPSALSAKNAADDKLPIVAYIFKGLADDQRRAIYQLVTGKALNAAPPNVATTDEVGTELPSSVALSAIPGNVTAQIPQAAGYDYAMAGDKLLLVSPVNRVVVEVIAP